MKNSPANCIIRVIKNIPPSAAIPLMIVVAGVSLLSVVLYFPIKYAEAQNNLSRTIVAKTAQYNDENEDDQVSDQEALTWFARYLKNHGYIIHPSQPSYTNEVTTLSNFYLTRTVLDKKGNKVKLNSKEFIDTLKEYEKE